jgi:glycopeptide antibiotics resistance protein
MRKNFFGLFVLYSLLLAEILLMGREADSLLSVKDYFVLHANVIPLKTLVQYISFYAAQRDRASFLLAFSNIGGNLILFLPMGFFLPALFAELRRSRLCLFVIFCLILAAELLQGIFRVGIPDIDDLTVNMLGAYVGFLLSKKFIFKHAVS